MQSEASNIVVEYIHNNIISNNDTIGERIDQLSVAISPQTRTTVEIAGPIPRGSRLIGKAEWPKGIPSVVPVWVSDGFAHAALPPVLTPRWHWELPSEALEYIANVDDPINECPSDFRAWLTTRWPRKFTSDPVMKIRTYHNITYALNRSRVIPPHERVWQPIVLVTLYVMSMEN